MTEVEHVVLCGGVTPSRPVKKSHHALKLDLEGQDPSVSLEITNIERRLVSEVPEAVVDLVEIASYVYCADQAVTRGGEGVLANGQGWRRRFQFHIPVRCPGIWSSAPVLHVLQRTLSFLSDDEYEFRFERRSTVTSLQTYLYFGEPDAEAEEIEQVLLFSGGLDSLAGAVQEAVVDKRRVALVSHRSNPKISSRQQQLVQNLRGFCKRRPLHVPVWVQRHGAAAREYTQRSRSFLFASLAFAVARVLKLNRIRFYENGVVSLNLPISEQAVGARATRTTHPQVLNGFAELFSLLLEQRFAVENPFVWRTRTEVVNLIGDAGCSELIQHSVSCMHTHEQTKDQPHCGRCSQCIGRRFATLASNYAEKDPADIYRVDLLKGERDVDKDVTLMESFIRAAKGLKDGGESELSASFGEVARVLRHIPGASADQVALNISTLQTKHALDVTRVLENAVSANSAEILEGRLPVNCAIVMAWPEKYRTASAERPVTTPPPPNTRAVERSRSSSSRAPYSPKDHRVYELVGQERFRSLTNEEIHKRYKSDIRRVLGKKSLSPDAFRATLNRVRRHWKLPFSKDISK